MAAAEHLASRRPQIHLYTEDENDEPREKTKDKHEGQSEKEITKQKHIRDVARARCVSLLKSSLGSSKAYREGDIAAYDAECLADAKLEMVGKITHEEKLEAILENYEKYIPETIAKVHELEDKFKEKISEAESKGWITAASATEWMQRLTDESVPWWKKNTFLTEKFPGYVSNWKKLDEDMTKVKNLTKSLNIAEDSLPELKVLKNKEFSLAHFTFRRSKVDEALAALAATEKGRGSQYQLAKKLLEEAVKKGAMAPSKVGTWLRRIFESSADPRNIQEFLTGKGNMTLSTLVWRWQQATHQFRKIEDRRKKEGTPVSFNFVNENKFLEMHYESRLAYIREANARFVNIQKENPLLLDIRRELDMKDWESARELISEAKASNLLPKDRQKLWSMETYLKTQEAEDGKEKENEKRQKPDPEEELQRALAEVPTALRPLVEGAMKRGSGVMRCLGALLYNRVWCHRHGYLTGHKEQVLRDETTEKTKDIVQHGHTKGFENNDVSSYHAPAIRDYGSGGIWSAQILHTNTSGYGPLLDNMESQKDNYAFKYWTTLIPEGVTYETQLYMVESLMPRLRSCLRTMEAQETKAAA